MQGLEALHAATGLLGLSLLLASLPLLAGHFPLILLLLLTALALAAAFLPATAPGGLQIRISDSVGLASLLLLPPTLAPLPLLAAGWLLAATRQTRAAQREMLIEGLDLTMVTLTGGWLYHWAGAGAFSLPAALAAFSLYGLILIGGRSLWLRARRRRCGLDAMALAAGAPPVLLMARLWPTLGPAGLGAGAVLLGLLLVVAHFGFEAALLRAQVRAMEQLSTVTLAQGNLPRLITRFLQISGGLVSAHRTALWLTNTSEFGLERAMWLQAGGNRTQVGYAGPATIRSGEGLVGCVAERQLPLIVRDGAVDPRRAEVEKWDQPDTSFSLLLLPLMVSGRTVGVAQFERDGPLPYTRRDMERVRALANQAAAAIVNARHHRDVTDRAETDGLTGLFNRRHIQAALESERRRALRYGHPLSVIMLDIDNFKSYNDTYGHTQGDVLIKMVAGLLRANFRSVDIVGRYGGEEFIVLLPETTKEEAGHTAERLRQSVAATAFPGFADDPEMAVLKTVSLGVATLPQDAPDAEMLVMRADQALYEAKRGGKNRVVLA
ncbi:MAG: sensor domain-containing diguanylate cyclase [Armatimonadetes bacterium]|nr:sensor domain-containing diguanylate cyclase [Armatimonadota bacterium]